MQNEIIYQARTIAGDIIDIILAGANIGAENESLAVRVNRLIRYKERAAQYAPELSRARTYQEIEKKDDRRICALCFIFGNKRTVCSREYRDGNGLTNWRCPDCKTIYWFGNMHVTD